MVPAQKKGKKMKKRNAIALLAALTALGCGVPDAETHHIAVDDDGNITEATLPDGTVVSGQEAYEAAIEGTMPPVNEMSTTNIEIESSSENLNMSKGVDIGKFRVQISPDVSYLDGCIRHSFLHLKLMVTNSKIDMGPMIELHFVAWFDSTAPCFAVMNTGFVGHGWCQKVCVKDVKKAVAGAIGGALIAAGLKPAYSYIISRVTAPVAAAALAL